MAGAGAVRYPTPNPGTGPVTRRTEPLRMTPAATPSPGWRRVKLRCHGTWSRIRDMSRFVCTPWFVAGLVVATTLPGVAAAAAHAPARTSGAAGPPAITLAARVTAEDGITLDEAIREVRQRYGEITILRARTKGRNGSRTHVIKFLTESGKVRTVRVDADTGEMR
jgi:hypothetical protein